MLEMLCLEWSNPHRLQYSSLQVHKSYPTFHLNIFLLLVRALVRQPMQLMIIHLSIIVHIEKVKIHHRPVINNIKVVIIYNNLHKYGV